MTTRDQAPRHAALGLAIWLSGKDNVNFPFLISEHSSYAQFSMTERVKVVLVLPLEV